jgi:hypothetical protein
MRYAQKHDKAGFFTNLMMVLSLAGLAGGARATASGSGKRSRASLSLRRPPEWQYRLIIQVEEHLPGHIGDSRGGRST